MSVYRYTPCLPCCSNPCGWGPISSYKPTDVGSFQQTNFSGSPSWIANGNGHLTMTGGSGTFWTSTGNPDATGMAPQGHLWATGSATIQAILHVNPSSTKSGVFIGSGRIFYADWTAQNYVYTTCDTNGSPGNVKTVVASTPKEGDAIALCIVRQVTGQFSISYIVNSIVVAQENMQNLNLTGPTFTSGFYGETAADFGTASLVCGSTCQEFTCPNCTTTLAKCWLLMCSGVIETGGAPFTAANGQFCLTASGCVLIDLANQDSWSVSIGSNPWSQEVTTPAGGSVMTFGINVYYTLNTQFDCNGANTFTLAKVASGTSDWPGSITISPTDCNALPCIPCPSPPFCASPIPSAYSVTIAGVTDVCFPGINGTFEMARNANPNVGSYYYNQGLWTIEFDIDIVLEGTPKDGCPYHQAVELYLTPLGCTGVIDYGPLVIENSSACGTFTLFQSVDPNLPATLTVVPVP